MVVATHCSSSVLLSHDYYDSPACFFAGVSDQATQRSDRAVSDGVPELGRDALFERSMPDSQTADIDMIYVAEPFRR